jgi:hypothetical protein
VGPGRRKPRKPQTRNDVTPSKSQTKVVAQPGVPSEADILSFAAEKKPLSEVKRK